MLDVVHQMFTDVGALWLCVTAGGGHLEQISRHEVETLAAHRHTTSVYSDYQCNNLTPDQD